MEKYNQYKDSGVHWIGNIPSHWKTCSVRAYTQEYVEKNKPEKTRELLALSYALGVTLYRDKQFNMDRVKENYEDYKIVHENVLVVSPNDIIKGSAYVSKYYGCISPMYFTFKSRFEDPAYLLYLSYLLRTKQAGRTFFSLAKGLIGSILDNGKYVTRRMSVSRYDLLSFKVVMPPLSEQRSIVAFLDKHSALIESIIANKDKEIQLLQELKQKTIAEAVTKGLNPNVKMKEYNSLISSQCPEHWKIMRNKSFLSLTGEKVGNRANEHTLLSLTTKGVIVRDLESGKGKFPKDFDTYQIVKKDDLVFCLFDIDETPRTVGLVDTEGMITGAYTALKVNQSIALPEYVYCYYLCVDDIKALKPYYSGLRKTVRADKFLQLYLPLPPLDEQQAIVSYIEEKCQKIDTLITELQAEIDYLKEYKQRLIADVVTGQVNVQNETI